MPNKVIQAQGYYPPRTATYVIASTDATETEKRQADEVVDGVIDAARVILAIARGGKVVLVGKTFNFGANIITVQNCVLWGAYLANGGQGITCIFTNGGGFRILSNGKILHIRQFLANGFANTAFQIGDTDVSLNGQNYVYDDIQIYCANVANAGTGVKFVCANTAGGTDSHIMFCSFGDIHIANFASAPGAPGSEGGFAIDFHISVDATNAGVGRDCFFNSNHFGKTTIDYGGADAGRMVYVQTIGNGDYGAITDNTMEMLVVEPKASDYDGAGLELSVTTDHHWLISAFKVKSFMAWDWDACPGNQVLISDFVIATEITGNLNSTKLSINGRSQYIKNLYNSIPVTVTIAGGAITLQHGITNYFVDTEGGAASDYLDTIIGGEEFPSGYTVTLFAKNNAHEVILRSDANNIKLGTQPDGYRYLRNTFSSVTLQNHGQEDTRWSEICHSYYSYVAPGEIKTAVVDLAQVNVNLFSFNWQNPNTNAVTVIETIVDITGAAPLAATMDIGSAANTGVHGNDILVALPLNAIAITSSLNKVKLAANGGAIDWVTGQVLLQNAGAPFAGRVYIKYMGT